MTRRPVFTLVYLTNPLFGIAQATTRMKLLIVIELQIGNVRDHDVAFARRRICEM